MADVLPHLVTLTRPKCDTSGGLATVQDICKNAQAFKVETDGKTVGAYAVEALEFDRGICLWITAGAGTVDGVDLTDTMQKVWHVMAQQIGAKQIGLITKRRGLIRKLTAHGWTVAGVKMVKKI